MRPELAKLKRLRRLERLRAIAKQTAAAEVAEAEGTLSQLNKLSEHTGRLAAQYKVQGGKSNGAELRQIGAFVRELQSLGATTANDAARARAQADRKQAELAIAERRRAVVEDRSERQERKVRRAETAQSLGSRRGFGTGLE